MNRWVALLRGINVGGRNTLPMADLRATCGWLGWEDVTTYIASGNVAFSARGDERELVDALGRGLADRHGLIIPVVVRSQDELAGVADRHPEVASGLDPKLLHVTFLDAEPSPAAVAALAPDRWTPDRWALVGRELFLTYPDGSARSTMTLERFERPWGVTATARNINTVRKLAGLGR